LDLQRRDFTINTLAVQLSPHAGRILDFYGGLADLRDGLIRVLHSLSFVDDPTRILRAVRFERRLGFQIEPRTAELIDTALPMLRRITGSRIRNELSLLLAEPDAAESFLILQRRGILKAIHPAFVVPDDLAARFERARTPAPDWLTQSPNSFDLDWCVMLIDIPARELSDLCERLLLSKALCDAITEAARLVQNLDGLTEPETPPSRVVARLDGIGELALYTAWLILDDGIVRERIWQYASKWRGVRPTSTGHTLRARGITPGPCYARILARLRQARLDGEIGDDEAENRLLDSLLTEGICDDGAE
ncbi:MAG: CCA tRNA nucleotidyltransferase, partial [Anaerolineae bacterium]|nr:CCA tRNA nucleotidyltransferase [Anaerolineae bacterium]